MQENKCTKDCKRIMILTIFTIFSIFFILNFSYATCNSSGICIIAFNSTQTFTVPAGITQIDVLLVGGGGGGGAHTPFSNAGGGAGGAGGLIFEENVSLTESSYNITIGEGGAGIDQEGTPADNGEDTIAFNLTALGGGGGILTSGTNNAPASDGGSGGGGRRNPAGIALQPSSIWGGYGNDGARNSNDLGGGGGGGAGSQPPDITGDDGGPGGSGLYYGDIFGDQFGDDGYFAGGGGGGGRSGTFGVGGIGGGGNGSSARDAIVPTNGKPNTGGGGGGGSSLHAGANGGSGVVIIRFIDNVSPSIEINNPLNNSYYDTQTHLLNISTSDNIKVDKVWYNWNGTNNTYTTPLNIIFPDGTHTLKAWANDTAGNINTTSITFTIDTINPNINIISPENINYNQSKVLLNISVLDSNLNTTWYNWNGTNNTYTNPINITFPDGTYTLKAWANDTAGNINTTNITFTIDTIAPNINIITPQNITYETLKVLLNITAFDTNLQTIWYNWNGSNITYTNPINITYNSSGSYTIFAWANDTAGNMNSTNITFGVTDNPIKKITLISPEKDEKVIAPNQIKLIWNITNILNQTMDCQIFVNSINIANQSCDSSINNSYTINVSRGNYNWSINASNSAGYYLKSPTHNFTIIEQSHVRINKSIRSENTNLFLIRTKFENLANRTSNLKVFEFVDSSLNAGSFTPAFDFINSTSGANYIGNIYAWNYNMPELSQNQLNYSTTKNTNYWQISKSYIIGIE